MDKKGWLAVYQGGSLFVLKIEYHLFLYFVLWEQLNALLAPPLLFSLHL